MNKKMIIGISIGISVALVSFIVFFGVSISGKTKEAKEAAAQFVELLQDAEMERLSLEFYTHKEIENAVYRDEKGNAIGMTLTEQQVADIFGIDAVLGISGETTEMESGDSLENDYIEKEEILEVIMRHTQIAFNVGTIWGEKGKMNLQMLMPDIRTWLQTVPEEELRELNAIEDNAEFLQALDYKMKSGEMESMYVPLSIPMVKQNNKWRFEVSEETEQKFFGGLFQLFEIGTVEKSE
jgi:hypothetical protein